MESIGDPRATFIVDYIKLITDIKNDKIIKAIESDNLIQKIENFFDTSNQLSLYITILTTGNIETTYEFPEAPKGKTFYFIKKSRGTMDKTSDSSTLSEALHIGDLSKSPINQFGLFVTNILRPVLLNEKNRQTWPATLSDYLLTDLYRLQKNTEVIAAKVEGRTHLAHPVSLHKLDNGPPTGCSGDDVVGSLMYSIESAVIDWTGQITTILKRHSGQPIIDGTYPTPHYEYDFWQKRMECLSDVYKQLSHPKVKDMAMLLEEHESAYSKPFKDIFKKVVRAYVEAETIYSFLTPLMDHIERMESSGFDEVAPLIQPLIHVVSLIWVNCQYYRKTERLVVLLTEICNLMIHQCREFLDPIEIIKAEPEEGLSKINYSLKTLRHLKAVCDAYRENVKESCIRQNVEPSEWGFHPPWIYARLESFMKRLEELKHFFQTLIEYNRLEKMEIMGINGNRLSKQIGQIFEEYLIVYKTFSDCNLDCLDPISRHRSINKSLQPDISTDNDEDTKSFREEYNTFMKSFDLFDYRLGTIAERAFRTCGSTEGSYRTIFMFGNILDRPLIAPVFDPNYTTLLDMLHNEIDECKLVYDDQRSRIHPIVDKDMPPITGAMVWANSLKQRANSIMDPLIYITNPVFKTLHGERLTQKYDELMTLLNAFYQARLKEFNESATERCNVNLKRSLLTRNEDKTLTLNFDRDLVEVLKEVNYLMNLGVMKNIPASANDLYERRDTLRQYRIMLEQIVDMYNYISQETLMAEYPLVEQEVLAFDLKIDNALKKLTWKDDANDYIKDCLDTITNLKVRVVNAKDNLKKIEDLTTAWNSHPLFLRKERKYDCSLNLEDRDQNRENRYRDVTLAGQQIIELLKENLEHFKVTDPECAAWLSYVEYVEDVVIDGLSDACKCSLNYLLQHTSKGKVDYTLIEAKLLLQDEQITYLPEMQINLPETLLDLIDNLMRDITKMAHFIPNLSECQKTFTYQDQIESSEEISLLCRNIANNVSCAMTSAGDYRAVLKASYAFFWIEDRKEFMRQFVNYGRLLTNDDIGLFGEIDAVKTPPTLEKFREQITKYDKLYDEGEKIDDTRVFDSWLRIDVKPFKHALLNVIKQWGDEFKSHLFNHVTDTLNNLKLFIESSTEELKVDIEFGDYNQLVKIMERLRSIRASEEATDAMFEPLKDTVCLLKEVGEEMPEATAKLLEELPEQWHELKNLSVITKTKVQPLQEAEIQNIKRKSIDYEKAANTLRKEFDTCSLFSYPCDKNYELLDQWDKRVADLEEDVRIMQESAVVFEVRDISNTLSLKTIRRDMKVLKRVWDYVFSVSYYVEGWKISKWKEINFGAIDEVIRDILQEIRGMEKEVKKWGVFKGLESSLKETNAAVLAVRDLQDPAIKDRHWLELMEVTKAKIVVDEDTTLAQLLSLNLHKYEEDVRGIVSKACNEMKIERDLEKIEAMWANMNFEYEPHERTQLIVPKSTEELTTTLEESQVKVLDMLGNRDNAFFFDKIEYWHVTLSTTDKVLSLMFEVERVWSGLESIFVLCDDIKTQLPEDTERFFLIDERFKNLMKEIEEQPKVIEATNNREGLFEELTEIRENLSLCEKALARYLETKRLAFPRFYFVSAVDLMDIVSNGKYPEKVMKHLSKLFDSIAKLKFKNDKDTIKIATLAHAKDGEKLKFVKTICLKGQVEEWLNALLMEMVHTMRILLRDAVAAYEDKPREQWLMDNTAQISLTGSQIGWTSEVQIAFARLEEGLENALKDYNKKQITQLSSQIKMLLNELTSDERQKIMTICTIDVHNRDVVGKLITQKVENSQAFTWLSQLRHRWDERAKDCFGNICDAQFRYAHEYLGNQARLVITPLTDRCYITLTQSLHLTMSGAPAGPAGTGKTETTKDLGRALGVMVYVFNCSEQMDYMSVGNIYKGLAQSGSWGCFDEFNRISVEVLSVVAVQVKSIQDAIKHKKERFDFLGENIALDPTVGLFITMNPGYAGRTELPENLKALFRPCAMVVPDFELICEIMLVAEGFLEARLLARKFITLYQLCKELLSKQDHYDWGLRAIKSVLVVAGSLKRGDKDLPEDQVLMRALRDFNTPKIVADDTPIFLGLICDLFPALNVPRQRNIKFEAEVKKATEDMGLQPEDNFILKVVQLQELFVVRHSVFIVGSAGSGKSQVWKSLTHTYKLAKKKPVAVDLNPKAVTNDELFGIINPATREWKDGLFSVIMRDLANMTTTDGPKWIVLDGDIDPMWIESLNTVMDDNKILTLASNERIPLTPTMRLLFEISHLKTATPATVSRAGILFINSGDLGWLPYVNSWLDERVLNKKALSRSERSALSICFEKYVPPCLDVFQQKLKKITPIPSISHVQTVCHLLECLLSKETSKEEMSKEGYEMYFVFCCIWAFGGCLFKDQSGTDYRSEFSKWWLNEFKQIKFPSKGTIFDFYLNIKLHKFECWTNKVTPFVLDPDEPLQSTIVPTVDVARISYFLDLLIPAGRPVMLVGCAGTGKSVLLQSKFNNLPNNFLVKNVPFNYYTTSDMLQKILEKSIEKKAGKNYGPPGQNRLIYFIDDMNMPEVDKYYTVQPHTLIRQHMDYGHWYDRQKMTLKIVTKTQYVAAMNPSAGSFTITPRLQRHFTVFALNFPDEESVKSIYSSILKQHMAANKFPTNVTRFVETIVESSIQIHNRVTATFLPTAIRFHYVFNLRDLSNIYQGLLFTLPEISASLISFLRVWIHEMYRVYTDKLVDKDDMKIFSNLSHHIIMTNFSELNEEEIFATPLLYCHFFKGIDNKMYGPVTDVQKLTSMLQETLDSYNDTYAAMNLVLFVDAIEHVLRINRILEMPRGNALLIGIGGSGKQSLSRLAAFISGMEVAQIILRKGYGMADLKVDLAALYMKTGLKNNQVVFLMTDAQVADEKFLVYINDLLSSGEIPDLFPEEDLDAIIMGVRHECKASGILDTNDNCWKFFIEKVQRLLRVILCFSPVGNAIRVRSRRFPALVNCTCIDWFNEWPHEALLSVSRNFLEEAELLDDTMKQSVSEFLAYAHTTVNEKSQEYLVKERRYNYTTPKSFLEQIDLYKKLLLLKDEEIKQKIQRLVNGLCRLKEASEQTAELKLQLADQDLIVTEKTHNANELIAVVAAETGKVTAEKEIAAAEEAKVTLIKKEVEKKQKECERDLLRAEPALIAAQEALNTLNKNNLTELKSLASPPPDVVTVLGAVMVLLAVEGRIQKDRSWKAVKAGSGPLSKLDLLLNRLVNYEKENIHPASKAAALEYCKKPNFDPDIIRSKSTAASGLCSWVINICKFHDVFLEVKPKRDALDAANQELKAAADKLELFRNKIARLEASLQVLTNEFKAATDEKLRCQTEADFTAKTLDLANRLVSGFASENVRWANQVEQYKILATTIPGDVLITCSFISYLGYFTKPFRVDLLENCWRTFLKTQENPIPIRSEIDPLEMLIDDAIAATWNNEGLPSDRMSIENATILTFCERWPLMVDPQLQAVNWIKHKYGALLKVVRLGAKGYLETIEQAVSEGEVVLIENIGETIDPVLDPIVGRLTIKKGKVIKLGDKEIPYNRNFKLILHTKLANPHYQPELQAQTTLINFTVTRDGLEEQLLAVVVSKERPDLEKLKSDLTTQQNEFKITLKNLEDSLLAKLSASDCNFLGDHSLVENLENSKFTAKEIEEKVTEAKVTEAQINTARNHYRPAATRTALIYFTMNDLNSINPMYQFSLKSFRIVFEKAIDNALEAENIKERLINITESITYSISVYTTRGLFEQDKLIFTVLVFFQVMILSKDISPNLLDFVLRYPAVPDIKTPVDFLNDLSWGGIKALTKLSNFRDLDKDVVASAKRWKAFVECECPEKEKLPQDWKNKSSMEKLCIMRALRPDRMTYALRHFVAENFGNKYVEGRTVEFSKSFRESSPEIPIFFILSPGVDPLKDVELLGEKLNFSNEFNNFHNISLGQGQEVVAETALEVASQEGHWVVLQNVHLVAKWLATLEKTLELYSEDSHEDYRVFISAEPAPTPAMHIIPQGILQNSIKITNEPPTGMQANLHKSLDNFTQETLEKCSKEAEFKPILFSLCYFHAVVTERRKFGAQGWNRVYPFNVGDLTICVDVLYNYLEANTKVPWEDLRYLFGEIMYGGHITDDWDRRLCRTYLEEYMQPELIEGDLYLAQGFCIPPNSEYSGYHQYIDDSLPAESPYLYGLHPNAEIEFLTTSSERVFRIVFEMQPRDSSAESGDGSTRDEILRNILDDLMDRIPDGFQMLELQGKEPAENRTPYTVVVLQECERMNTLLTEIRRSLKEFKLGLKGELTITSSMETLSNSLFLDQVPESWERYAYPSLQPLALWFADLISRVKELYTWTQDFSLPGSVWLGGLFNPQSFLTAVMQQTARKNEWPLDRMVINCDVTKKNREDMGMAPREGAYVHGLFMEGARWDMQVGFIVDARLKELAPMVPVIFLKAIPVERQDLRTCFACPVYKTKHRGPTYVWTFNLKTREKPAKWILGGVALLLQ